ncbi:FecR family protein [Sunxiuqinia elliptica]|uniref:FecR family protein n=1 Tax=Sunxiuqinia elliptica TaxID=655355 RepID=A0A4R6H5N4_9BACT|nr:FecR domain-containing protein [Sunxiuqinia elliptica]TDO03254.1 FecR family protein [Sunxiuqinia elliptica]TDO59451.1 FecR family protein [Sunxiuqinia elliptica]
MSEDLLLHILTGEASDEEKEVFYKQLAQDKKQEELFMELKSLWLRTSIQNTKIDEDAEFNEIWRKVKKGRKKVLNTTLKVAFRYAAILIVVIGLSGAVGYFISQGNLENKYSQTQQFMATKGSVSVIELADGTKIWLNSDSKLSFRENHKKKERQATLIGEAYFQITHREDFPFIVKTGKLIVRDLGTTFNIKAYPEDNFIETSLVEGEADILSNEGSRILSLTPGESALYLKEENRMELRSLSSHVLSAWRDGKFVIRDERLEDIFNELSRWYGVEFKFENEALRDYRFTGNIKKTTTAQHVLKVLKAATDFDYKIIENVEKADVIILY